MSGWLSGRDPFDDVPSHAHETSFGSVRCVTRRPGWLFITVSGHLSRDHADTIFAGCDAAIRIAPKVRFAHDWGAMTSFDATSPPRMVTWIVKNRGAILSADIYLRSPFVAMATRAANITLGNVLSVTTDYTELGRRLAAHGL